jgi:ATP-dependent helicase/nuclease subunit A
LTVLLSDPALPGDLNRILIVSFTRASAAEMRQRIMDRLTDALEMDPDNAHLRHQLTAAGQASIGTIDSYCSFLVRSHFHRADIAPDLRLADKAEMDLLWDQLLDRLLEEAYMEGRDSFFRLLSAYSSEKNHGNIKKMIRDLYQSSQNAAFPEQWLSDCVRRTPRSREEFLATEWMRAWFSRLESRVRESLECARSLKSLFEADPDSKEYRIAAQDEALMEHILRAENGEELLRRIEAAAFPTNSGLRSENKDLFSAFRGRRKGKGYLARFCGPADDYKGTEEEKKLFLLTEEPRRELVRLTLRFSEALKEACRDRNITDFSGMEHLALELWSAPGKTVPWHARSWQRTSGGIWTRS